MTYLRDRFLHLPLSRETNDFSPPLPDTLNQQPHPLHDAVEKLSPSHVLDAHVVGLGVVFEELKDFNHVRVLERPQDAHLRCGFYCWLFGLKRTQNAKRHERAEQVNSR